MSCPRSITGTSSVEGGVDGLCCVLPATMLPWTVATDAADRAHEPQLISKLNLMPPKKKIASMHKTKTAAKPACTSGPRAGSPREQFVALLLDLGLSRASELLGTLQERGKQVAR